MGKTSIEKPLYADFDAPRKFLAIQSIIAKRLTEHPNAICAYSGGSDSDIMLDLIEKTRELFGLPPVHYVFFNTGLEMKATKDHVKEVEKKYGVEIEEARPSIGIVQASRKYGIPIFSKLLSEGFERWQRKDVPISIIHEFNEAEDQAGKRAELSARFPKCETVINFLCSCDRSGKQISHAQFTMASEKYLSDFVEQCPPDFKISAKCCYYCKKQIAHQIQKDYEMIITGERMVEGGGSLHEVARRMFQRNI